MGRRRKIHLQLALDQARKPIGQGGWRPNAGRPRGRTTPPHDTRPVHVARNPVHVTLRLRADVPSIARTRLMQMIRGAIKDSQKVEFRIVEFNIISNHIHLLTEASSTRALSRGVQGLAGRLALRTNRSLKRCGKVFATRFHARALSTPRDVRNVLRYVLLNRKHHDTETQFDRYWIDPYSSAAWFDGWAEPIRGNAWRHELMAIPPPVMKARTWLLSVGWRRCGALRFDEQPAPSRSRVRELPP
jgi:REP element-mobilizing transposase RayT